MDTTEIVQTIDHLQRTFEDLMIRGLKAAGPGEMNTLANIREECERIGAYHLAGRVEAILDAINKNERTGAQALMCAQTSLRMFDRILTLEYAQMILGMGVLDPMQGIDAALDAGVRSLADAENECDDDGADLNVDEDEN